MSIQSPTILPSPMTRSNLQPTVPPPANPDECLQSPALPDKCSFNLQPLSMFVQSPTIYALYCAASGGSPTAIEAVTALISRYLPESDFDLCSIKLIIGVRLD
ncbi:hypothetical protein L1887_11850 [Cichorium endivia]|nr:hypothetical protein L1887_11850 [Cichorium endivia]